MNANDNEIKQLLWTRKVSLPQVSSEELVWTISWILAFPTLVPSLLFTSEHDTVWQKVAFDQIINYRYRNEETKRQQQLQQQNNYTQILENNERLLSIDQGDRWMNSLGYGEISESTIFYIFDAIRILENKDNFCFSERYNDNRQLCSTQNMLSPSLISVQVSSNKKTIVDLGSGHGRVLIAAALCSSTLNVIGIEIVQSLHTSAINTIHQWTLWEEILLTNGCSCSDVSNTCITNFQLFCNDFTISSNYWISVGDIIFIHATVFEDTLMNVLCVLCEQCKSGTYFILISKNFNSPFITTILELHLEMSWGIGTVYLQKRI